MKGVQILKIDFYWHLSSGSGTCSEYSNQHKDTSAIGLSGPSDLPYDVRTWLRQQRLLICLPVPSRRGGPVEVNTLCPFHSLTQHYLPCTWPDLQNFDPAVWFHWHACAGSHEWMNEWVNEYMCRLNVRWKDCLFCFAWVVFEAVSSFWNHVTCMGPPMYNE